MKSRDTLIRLKRFQVEEKRRRLAQIEMMISEFTRMATDLDREIGAICKTRPGKSLVRIKLLPPPNTNNGNPVSSGV